MIGTGLPSGYVEFFNQVRLWGRSYESLSTGERERIDAIVGLVPDDVRTVLDIGCADGIVTNRLIDLGLSATGTDITDVAFQHVRAPVVVAPSHELPFGDREFDCAVAADLLEHIPAGSFEQTLSEIDRVAARYLVINTPHREDLVLAQTRCGRCATVFHASRHLRSVRSSDVAGWFPRFEIRSVLLAGEPWPRRSRALQRLAQVAGNVWYRTETVCPMCAYPVEPPVPNPVVRALNAGVQRLLGSVGASRPSELVVLLERR